MESKYRVGDRVLIKDHMDPKGAMVETMLEKFGGEVCTVSKVVYVDEKDGFAYEIEEDDDFGAGFKYHFLETDIECLTFRPGRPSQRIEIPVPGGNLVAETCDWGGSHPGIFVSFVPSGESAEQGLCFAEVAVESNPNVVRVGTYYTDGEEVKDIVEYPMRKE